MSGGLLDFFSLEAGEYTEQLDGALARAAGKMPDLDVFTRNARALRGSATMARVEGIARIATGLERLGRGLRDGSLQWTPQLRAAIVAAVDDVKILVRNARTWSAADDERVAARAAELDGLAPAFQRRSVVTPMVAVGSGLWLASEAAEISGALRKWVDARVGFDALAETVKRIRALRGIAALADLPPVKDVIDTVDDAAKSIELGTAPTDAHRYLFRTAADVLREAAEAVQAGRKPPETSGSVAAFTAAASLLVAGAGDKDYVVPISALFPDGGGENVVHAAPNPPTTLQQRFRMEVVSQAEHLRRLVADARTAASGPSRQRTGNDLRAAARALQRAAESFGEQDVARMVQGLVEPAAALETRALDELDRVAASLAAGSRPTPVVSPATPSAAPPPAPPAATAAPAAKRPTPAAPPRAEPAPPRPAAAALAPTPYMGTPAVSRATGAIVMPAPTGDTLEQALASGLSSLERLSAEPLAEPAVVEEDEGIVPIQDLLYRGRAALLRAVEVGEAIKAGGAAPSADALAELFDLLELATTE
jgi:chemotaxis protein histidine kinase CheA